MSTDIIEEIINQVFLESEFNIIFLGNAVNIKTNVCLYIFMKIIFL